MKRYRINEFWKKRFRVVLAGSGELIQGWSYVDKDVTPFVEAPLVLSEEVNFSVMPEDSPLILVSAPGAVGKSTLAKKIAYECGAVYVDLAKADTVGGNTLSGGIMKSKLGPNWENGKTAILIDGLDEARLRVTLEGYEDFLSDVATIAVDRSEPIPTVLFGRTGAVQDAYLAFSLKGLDVPILEIDYFDPDGAIEFAMEHLCIVDEKKSTKDAQRRSVSKLVEGLSRQTESDGKRFAGYAPVLQSVAESVLHPDGDDQSELIANPHALASEIEQGRFPLSIVGISKAIMDRESGKVKTNLDLSDTSLNNKLYQEDEQILRLAQQIYDVSLPIKYPAGMTSEDMEKYTQAVTGWVQDHPFLISPNTPKPSSAVFEACIIAKILTGNDTPLSSKILRSELGRGLKVNPFLSEFYNPEVVGTIPAEHVGLIYNSFRSRLSIGDNANLTIEANGNREAGHTSYADAEITIERRIQEKPRALKFKVDLTGPLQLGPQVVDVEISVPESEVIVEAQNEAKFFGPVSIQCGELNIESSKVSADGPKDSGTASIFLEAKEFSGNRVESASTMRDDVELSVCWPDCKAHPWHPFASKPSEDVKLSEEEPLRRLRKFIVVFNASGLGKGLLSRHEVKIQDRKMTKGDGQKVLDALLDWKVLTKKDAWYFLNTDTFASVFGCSFHDIRKKEYNQQTRELMQSILKND